MRVRVVTTYLEMTDPGQLRPPRAPDPGLEVRRAEVPCPELNRFLYTAVGGPWYWIERLGWDRIHRALHLTQPFYERFTPAISARDFALRRGDLERSLDLLAVLRPQARDRV